MNHYFQKTALILASLSVILATANYLGLNLHNILLRMFFNE
jgi:hypothetical protein